MSAPAGVAPPDLRALEPEEAHLAAGVIRAAIEADARARGEAPAHPDPPARAARWRAILARFAEIDRGGCFLAVGDGDEAVGVAISLRRGDLWGLSLLFVHPDHQSHGLGRELLEATLGHAEGARVRMIQASTDPRAVRRYAGAGLAVHPAMTAEGIVPAGLVPAGLPPAVLGGMADLDLVDAVDADLRGSSRRIDVEHTLLGGGDLLIDADGRGFAVQDDSRPLMIGARDEATAARLLWQCFARATKSVRLTGLTATQDWAMRVCLDAGLPLKPGGPMCLSGLVRVPGPYYPSGIYF